MNNLATKNPNEMDLDKLKKVISEFFSNYSAYELTESIKSLLDKPDADMDYLGDSMIETAFAMIELSNFLSKLEKAHLQNYQAKPIEQVFAEPTPQIFGFNNELFILNTLI